ncbi:hypothetical protein PGT21_012609 [Puccinia graminis f. sp. tritici]|uniref:Uncharacterized protein n=1 Tax=Puccinia graminis f. sp. tritici TaxID=56615 RepID=A0A5B0NS46_PUCGR|nr:hypothetical protein PGTUg99_001915 [Puccinia graminis f. sp. tritici]KAA1090749.1 hypothetical protein PGT21_012609 [Puccinia graminis f. sp. tritici]
MSTSRPGYNARPELEHLPKMVHTPEIFQKQQADQPTRFATRQTRVASGRHLKCREMEHGGPRLRRLESWLNYRRSAGGFGLGMNVLLQKRDPWSRQVGRTALNLGDWRMLGEVA